jgi:hypothetical protein
VQKYRYLFYDKGKNKKVPLSILNGTRDIRRSFFDGYYLGDGCKSQEQRTGALDFCVKGKIGAQGLYYIVRSLGHNHVTITTRDDKMDIFRIKAYLGGLTKHPNAIKKIIVLPPQTTYVYDIETENGHFGAGVGQLVVHNTDSVYFTIPQDDNDLVKSFEIGQSICTIIGERYGAPIELEMEKVYRPMVYVAKKMYAAIMYESPTDTGKLDVKGLSLVKGDSSQFTRKLQLDVINAIIHDPISCWVKVKTLVVDAIQIIKTVDKKDLVKQVKLGSDYKNPDGVIAVQVAKRMKIRGQQEPQPGESVQFLVQKVHTSKRVCDRADHPGVVTELDYDYYIDRQIIKPITRILDVVKADWRKYILY